jgi:hypothetical protein
LPAAVQKIKAAMTKGGTGAAKDFITRNFLTGALPTLPTNNHP